MDFTLIQLKANNSDCLVGFLKGIWAIRPKREQRDRDKKKRDGDKRGLCSFGRPWLTSRVQGHDEARAESSGCTVYDSATSSLIYKMKI